MRNVIFLSPPGAGKGTMSEYLVKEFNYEHISTGNMLREKAKVDESIAAVMKSGALVSDDVMISLLKETLSNLDKNKPFILDGLPRTLHQAEVLDIILNDLGKRDYVVVYIDVDQNILLDRVIGRRVCPRCHKTYNCRVVEFMPKEENICDLCGQELMTRTDDNEESFTVRYQNYLDSTHPLLEYYKNLNRLKTINNNSNNQNDALLDLVGVISD